MANIVEVILYRLLSISVVLSKLKKELKAAASHVDFPISQSELGNLPYLTGVIKKGLRLSYGRAHAVSEYLMSLCYSKTAIGRGPSQQVLLAE